MLLRSSSARPARGLSAPGARRSARQRVVAVARTDEEETISRWRSWDGYDAFPGEFIACPLPAGHALLTMPYSLSHRASTVDSTVFNGQADALTSIMKDPPATMPRRSLAHRPPTASFSDTTITDRRRTAGEFVGFAANVLALPATMEHVLDPMVLAKFGGWHEQKGTTVLTLKKIMTHLAELAPFVSSKHCPGINATYGADHMEQLDRWFTHIIRKLQSRADALRRVSVTDTDGLTLSAMWDSCNADWAEHDKEVEKHGWTYDNVMRRQDLVLESILAALHQPAMRQGLLRTLHTSTSAAHASVPCAFEGCKRSDCTKNRIRYIDDGEGQVSVVIECVHFKYSKVKGPQVIHLAPELSERVATLDRVMREHVPGSATLFCQRRKRSPYSVSGFNALINKKLLRYGNKKVAAFKVRRMFIRAFRDFHHHPSTFAAEHERNIQQATESAARMMLNSPGVWDHYDDMAEDRSMRLALHLWPRFVAFVREQDAKQAKKRYVDVDTYLRQRQQ